MNTLWIASIICENYKEELNCTNYNQAYKLAEKLSKEVSSNKESEIKEYLEEYINNKKKEDV